MALSIADIREALAEQVAVALEATSLPVNAYGYPPDSPALNALCVLTRPVGDAGYIDYHASFGRTAAVGGALCHLGLRIELRAGGGQIDATRAMDLWLSAGNAESVIDALLADVTLDGLIQTMQVVGVSPPAWFTAAGDEGRTWLASFIDIDIYARR